MIERAAVRDLIQELQDLQTLRVAQGWDTYWKNAMRFALPQDISYEQLLHSGNVSAITGSLAQQPSSARDVSKRTYDQTSLWAVERLSAGLLSLKTPEASHWHGLSIDDPFGYEATHVEESWLDKLTRYLFKVRSNPRTGFWPSHKAALRSVCALGDGYIFLEEMHGDQRRPWRYNFVPLGECYRTVDEAGQTLRFYRHRQMTAEQIVKRWPETASETIKSDAARPDRRQTTYPIAHAVVPRDPEIGIRSIGVFSAPWMGVYVDIDGETALEETGYWEMPYIGHSWNSISSRAYSEGPMALALAEIKSLNEMAKNELVSSQQAVRPPLASVGDNFTRINLNAGAVNAGLVNGDGRLLVQPIMTHTRPDFAQQVLESRRNNVREMLYLNLWQILIERPDMTATEALLRSQEKGDLLGPVGISFNHSLSQLVDREIAILARKGAFEADRPLAIPESMAESEIGPNFTSPLDRMRSMDEVVGAQRTVQGMLEVAAFDPEIMKKLNVDAYAEMLRKGNGAPADLFLPEEDVKQAQEQGDQMEQLAQVIELAKQGGEAAGAMGAGVQQLQATGMGAPAADVQQAVA